MTLLAEEEESLNIIPVLPHYCTYLFRLDLKFVVVLVPPELGVNVLNFISRKCIKVTKKDLCVST